MKITALQFEIKDGAAEENLATALRLLREAPGADVYLLPELFTSGYAFSEWERIADEHTPRAVAELEHVARAKSGIIVSGMISRTASDRLANRAWAVGGEQPITYDKAHLIAAFREPELLECGASSCLTEIAGAKTHISICFDLRFPELYRAAAKAGAEIFLVISEWPSVRGEALRTLARARAMENQAFVALCNRTGCAADGTGFGGASAIFDPQGVVLAEAGEREAICTAEVNVNAARELRQTFPVLGLSRAWE